MLNNPTELEKKLFDSISKQKNNQNCHEIEINKKLPVNIKQVTPEKEGYANACIISNYDIILYNTVKKVIDNNKIDDYNSIPLSVKKFITENFIETKLIKSIDEETFIELASYYNLLSDEKGLNMYKDYGLIYVKVKKHFEELAQKDLDPLGDIKTELNEVQTEQKYEMVNHPTHYNNYDKEVIEMMINIWGPEETAIFCKLNAFKYRLRMGTKPDNDIQQDLNKEKWYLKKFHELKKS